MGWRWESWHPPVSTGAMQCRFRRGISRCVDPEQAEGETAPLVAGGSPAAGLTGQWAAGATAALDPMQ